MGQAKFIVSLVMISLFTIAILSYSIGFANDNDSAISLEEDEELNNLNTNLLTTSQADYLDYNSSEKAFRTNVIESGDNNLLVGGTLTDIGTTPRKSFNYILGAVKIKIFGNDVRFGVILNAFMGIIIILGLMFAWKTIKGGNPD